MRVSMLYVCVCVCVCVCMCVCWVVETPMISIIVLLFLGQGRQAALGGGAAALLYGGTQPTQLAV